MANYLVTFTGTALSEGVATKITALMGDFTASLADIDYSLLMSPIVQVFPSVFTVMLALGGIRKAIGFVKSILGI